MTVEGKPKRNRGRPSRSELLAAALGKYVAWAEGHPLEAELDVRRLIVAGGPLSGYGMPDGVGKSTYYSHRDNDPRVTALDLRLKSLAEQRDALKAVSRGRPDGAEKQASPAVTAPNEPTQPGTPDRAQLDARYRELHLAAVAVSQQLQGRLRKPGHVSSVSRALFHTDRARASLSHLVSELTKLRDAWNRISGEDPEQQMDLLALDDLHDDGGHSDGREVRVQ